MRALALDWRPRWTAPLTDHLRDIITTLGRCRPAADGRPTTSTYVAAVCGLALIGAGLGLSMQAYTLLGQAVTPATAFGSAMALLTFGRRLCGSLGGAAFGWILVLDRAQLGETLAPGIAAALAGVALSLAPRSVPSLQASPT